MATVSEVYDGSAVTITTTALATLAAAAWWQSASVDNTTAGTPSASISDQALDVLVQVTLGRGSTALSADKAGYVYAYGSADGSTYPDTVTGSQGTFTPRNTDGSLLRLLAAVPMSAISQSYITVPLSVAAAFGGQLPRKWGIVVFNNSGGALTSAAAVYQAIKQQVV